MIGLNTIKREKIMKIFLFSVLALGIMHTVSQYAADDYAIALSNSAVLIGCYFDILETIEGSLSAGAFNSDTYQKIERVVLDGYTGIVTHTEKDDRVKALAALCGDLFNTTQNEKILRALSHETVERILSIGEYIYAQSTAYPVADFSEEQFKSLYRDYYTTRCSSSLK